MKTLRLIMFALGVLAFCGAAKATTPSDNGKLTENYAINTYIDAMTRGRLGGLNEVLDKSAVFSTSRGKQVLSVDKKEMIDYLKTIRNTEQGCLTSTSIVESNDAVAIVKVDMKYANFTRSNYITIANTGNGWKITNVYSIFS
jgi:hypothetical protein